MIDFLNRYPAEEAERISAVVEDAIRRLPYTLSFPVRRIVEEIRAEQYEKTKTRMMSFFSIAIPYVSYVFFRLLQRHAEGDAQVHDVLSAFVNRLDTKRPLSDGDWLNDMLNPLLFAAVKHMPDHPLTQSFRAHILHRRSNILLGDKTGRSIVQIRNEYMGHGTTLSEEINRAVAAEMEPRLLRLIEALMPLASCRYDIRQGAYRIAFEGEEEGRSIDLFPLVFVTPQDYRYVMNSLRDEQASFLSSNENAETLITDSMNRHIDLDLQRVVPSFDIAKAMNWMEMKRRMHEESARYLRKAYVGKKYNSELFVERQKLTQTLHSFWRSDATLFPLLGEAGQGKTNQLCYWAERLMAEGMPVMIFNSSDFTDVTLDRALRLAFDYKSRRDIARLLDAVHAKAVENGQPVYIFFDALNECLKYADADSGEEGSLALFNAIRRLLAKPSYTHFKTLITCRVYTWKNVIQPSLDDCGDALLFTTDDEGGMVRGFDADEAAQAYQIYQNLYQMHTPYGSLDRRVALRFKDPLILKFASTNFLGLDLPPNPERYTSLSLFAQMLDSIGNSYAGRQQRQILQALADRMLDLYLQGVPVDGLPAEELRAAYADEGAELHGLAQLMYKKDGISIAYAELLNKSDRPILREAQRIDASGERHYVQFIYERFLEYVLSDALTRRAHGEHGADRPLPAEFFAQTLASVRPNVVLMGAICNTLLADCMRHGDFTALVELERQWGEDYTVISLVTETINTMIRENYEGELFALMERMLASKEEEKPLIEAFNGVVRAIESNQADEKVIADHKRLAAALAPTMRLKKRASVSTVNGIMLTDYFNEGLYGHDVMGLLWRIMLDPIYDIRNDACVYAYYLSNRRRTLDYTPLRENLTVRIIKEMYANIKSRGLLSNFISKARRSNAMLYLETASRLCVLVIIDHSRGKDEESERIVADMLNELRAIFRYLTGNLNFVRFFLPFFQIAMKRQITFQSDYVNNAIEYQTFWDEATFTGNEHGGVSWQNADVDEVMRFAYHFQRYGHLNDTPECREQERRFALMHKKILSAYKTGDSFSHFILERILVIMGTARWQNIEPIVDTFFTDEFRRAPWFDYCQMSLLYVLYQVEQHTPEENRRLLDTYGREAVDWTCRNRGLYRGRRSEKANPVGMYKRNVMCWYAVTYCTHTGDGVPRQGDERPVPMFYALIDRAIADNDKELLFHLIENISELITDMGYVQTALALLKHILVQYDTQEKVDRLDAVALTRGGIYQYDLVRLVGNVFSTAKNYYAQQVDLFIQKEIAALTFPGVPTYREDILNYHPSGENLSDLLTHRFGNFLMWGLLNIEAILDFAGESIAASTKTKDCYVWYEKVVKIFIKHFFGIRI